MNIKALVAEFIGTFTLIFIGAGAAAVGVGGIAGAAFAHGFVVLGFIYAYGHISGTHINPAVTLSMLVVGEIKLNDAIGYIVVQMLGGLAGAALMAFVLGGTESGLGVTVPAEGVTVAQTFVVETVLTFLLVTSIFHAAVDGKAGDMAAVAIGCTLIALIFMGGPLTGAALNPARTFGPAVMTGTFTAWPVYLVGPPLGGIAAALLYQYFFKE